jgi:hypothetical protein
MRVRYVGSHPTTFVEIGLELLPDEEFDVPPEDASKYLSRVDLVEVAEHEAPPNKPVKARPRAVEDAVPDSDQPTGDQEPGTDNNAS